MGLYFESRVQAGRQLAGKLAKYKDQKCAVVALGDGGVMVGAQIALALHGTLMMLLVEQIQLPREPDAVGSINQEGGMTYNSALSSGQLDELTSEYYQYIEQSKVEKIHNMHRQLGGLDTIDEDLLRNRIVILVADGLPNGSALDAVGDYLKPIKTARLVVATPLASVPAVDRMHLLADEICCLNVVENYMDTDHYYEDNALPEHETIVKGIQAMLKHAQDGVFELPQSLQAFFSKTKAGSHTSQLYGTGRGSHYVKPPPPAKSFSVAKALAALQPRRSLTAGERTRLLKGRWHGRSLVFASTAKR